MEEHPDSPVRQLARALLVDIYSATRPTGARPGPAELRRAARTAVLCLEQAVRSPAPAQLAEARAALDQVALHTRRCRRQGLLAERPTRTLLARQAAATSALDELLRTAHGERDRSESAGRP
jgi:hypothetical protein